MKNYFCEHCFENENIKQYIRDYGEKIEKKLDCSFCTFETEIYDEYIYECIDEYIQKCMNSHEEKLTEKEFEDREIALDEECIKECKEKYQTICEDKVIEPTYIIKEEILIQKFREVILKLYTYDWNNTYDDMCRNASQNYCEGEDNPEYYANLLTINDLEGIEGKEEYRFSTLEEIFIDFEINDMERFEEIFNRYIITDMEFHIAYTEGGELEDWNIYQSLWKYNCLYSTDEYKLQDWEVFREHTKHKARYFEHEDNKFSAIKTLEDFKPFFEKMTTYSDKEIYRVRPIYTEKDKKDIRKKPNEELGKAPQHIVKNNRFSPIGISYGYFAFDKETALIESRVKINDEVGIGEFKLDKSLKLIDFTYDKLSKYLNPFSDDFNIDLYCNSFFVQSFIQDISKPISDDDSLLEYIPTQIMAEYIWSIGYDGFIFDSSQKKGGRNVVIFGDNPQYKNCQIAKIINIEYHLEEVKSCPN
jgi:hypothetical protein